MRCPTCHSEMIPCQMNAQHFLCPQCSDAIASALKICRPCLNEYDASVQFRAVQMVRDPEEAKNTNWCDDCNDWMPLQHQHKTRKKWLG